MKPSTADGPAEARHGDERASREDSIFRERARAAADGPRHEGELLRLSPGWARSVYWVLVGMSLLLLVGSLVGRAREYASGPAVLRMREETRLTALTAGTVQSVEVRSGQHVTRGQPLVRFHSEEEDNVLAHLQTEFDLQLVRLLRDPGDEVARGTLANLRARIKLAEATLAERTLVAPAEGWVQDIRIHPGQLLTAGEPVVSLVEQPGQHGVVAFLPGESRPLLHVDQELQFTPAGYRHSKIHMKVESVQEEVVGPQAALAMLGREWQDAIPLQGSVVVVTASLSATTFRADGEERPLFSGMQGTAEICVRNRPILLSLIPGLDAVFEKVGR